MAPSYPKVNYSDLKVTYCYPKVTYSDPRVTYSDPRVTYSDPKVTHNDKTHIPLPPPTPHEPHLAINWVKLNVRMVGGGWQLTLM